MTTRAKIHLWIPNLFEFKGGIQTYSAFFLEALQNIYPDANYEIFIKHDTKPRPDFTTVGKTKFHCSGIVPLSLRTPAFAAQILTGAIFNRPDLIISTHLNFTPVAYLLKRFLGIPYWTVAHGIEAWNIQDAKIKKALHHCDRILAVSRYTGDRLTKEQGLNPEKISILYNTFDPRHFQPAVKPTYLLARHNLAREQPIILTVGRLSASERYKGYDQMIQAMVKIRSVITNVHYMIVGKGDDQLRIEQLIDQLELGNCITLVGFVPDDELCDYYNLCDVFAMPSKGEGFGIVYLEALACGKPVLGGNQDAAIDALCHGKLGALVNPDDIDEIAQTIIQILQGRYVHDLVYQPLALQQAAIDTFGFEQFQKTLSGYL
ncbi:glycosyltransferase [Cylindrospermopsis raciborskii CS-506_D]|uniref:Glycosyltransferase n=1 Tax=Cylindrospermopsis raciborskii CS-506_A TaxID=2585140 RepID=A0A838WRQ3_9CYAN|nr:glycosyltransferase [Cylindrospermopsis raciborskii]MBA4445335.1 glycosyltransferase [Cylindrospermopsis raciborskii CS-506_C]MBA4449575.1 glycosyltransferase [Cylindrospermopsis raciborskii CS-506_D]MBA4456196.1 glycosyltransferase [Cylindrospermopsis raciborskii CS-506_B]MBA4465542.1 glycosyltransferase [Cylindrospermopsis raciborskii CS-506_A]